jgi:release factor glutamine methyltransferase
MPPVAGTVADWLAMAARRVGALDARLLLAHVLRLSRAQIICQPDRLLDESEFDCLAALVARREAGEPLAYLTGEAGFHGRLFWSAPAALVPRPETEELVERALAFLATLPCDAPRVVDLGTGSGVIAITLALACPRAIVTGVEASEAALALARANAGRHHADVRLLAGDWFSALAGERFHVALANPPYLAADDPHLAGDGLRHEPRMALTDEGDGFSALAAIIRAAPAHLVPGGLLLCEHGRAQGSAMREALALAGFSAVQTWPDMAGHPRMSGGLWLG